VKLKTIVPPITGLVDEAYPLIVALNSDKPWAWLYSNYIQLALKNDEQMGYNIRFYKTDHRGIMWDTMNPWIKYNIMNVGFLKALGMGIIDFVIRSIDNGYYVAIYLDRFYIPGVRNYQQSHMTHEAMVFGYDLSNKKINLIEYTGAYLTEFSIDFAEFEQAYEHCDLKRYDEINLCKLDSQRQYQFDLINVYEHLTDYLTSRNTSQRYRNNSNPIQTPFFTFGVAVYQEIKRLLDVNELNGDFRVFNSIWEHKKLMTSRARYMVTNQLVENFERFITPCESIENTSYLLKCQFMKYSATKKPKALDMVYHLLEQMVSEEKALLSEMREAIGAQIEKNRTQEEKPWRSKHSFTEGMLKLDALPVDFSGICFDVIPQNDGIDGVIGYCDSHTEIIGYSELKLLLKFHPDGYFQARNGDQYDADCLVPYSKGKRVHVTIKVDFSKLSYCITVETDGEKHELANHYAFGSHAMKANDLDKLSMTVNNFTGFMVENHHFL
jgi:hypothetical protein